MASVVRYDNPIEARKVLKCNIQRGCCKNGIYVVRYGLR